MRNGTNNTNANGANNTNANGTKWALVLWESYHNVEFGFTLADQKHTTKSNHLCGGIGARRLANAQPPCPVFLYQLESYVSN